MKQRFLMKSLMAVLVIFGVKTTELIAQDTPCAATALSLGVTVSADNSTATPDGPQASCWSDNGVTNGGVTNDIWFSFMAPASGGVLVETFDVGTGNNDTQVAIYSSSDGTCGGVFTEVGCSDDIDAGNFMSAAQACDLTTGATYYVQVDGWGGTIGGFDIRVSDNPACVSCDPAGCDAGNVADTSPQIVCGNETITIDALGQAFPTDGDCISSGALIFSPQAGATGGIAPTTLTFFGLTWPYTFDADLNGVLSFNTLDSLRGDYAIYVAVYNDFDGTTCSISSDSVIVSFLAPGQGPCTACDPTGCNAGEPADDSDITLCPDQTADINIVGSSGPTDPTCASEYRLRFRPQAGATGGLTDTLCNSVALTLIIDPSAPFTLNGDLGGFDSFLLNPLRGDWIVDGISVVDGFICDSTSRDILVSFLDYDEAPCLSKCAPDQNDVDLSITFDDFSSETSYALYDDQGNLVDSAGPGLAGLACFDKSFCLEDGCYVFTIYDAFEDGICCGEFGDGSYALTDSEGNVLASGGVFLASESTSFCVGGDDCTVFETAPVGVTKSFEPVPIPDGIRNRVQLKWYKALPKVKYSDEDAAMCDITAWAVRTLDPVTGAVTGIISDPDSIKLVDRKKTFGDGSPRSIFKWPLFYRADGANNTNRVEPNTRYRFRVRCECGFSGDGLESPWSEEKTFNTPDFDPVTGVLTLPPGIEWDDDFVSAVLEDKSLEAPMFQKGEMPIRESGLARVGDDAIVQKVALQKGKILYPREALTINKKSVSSADDMSLFPNPVQDELTIMLSEKADGMALIRIMDMTGRMISTESSNLKGQNGAFRLDMSDLRTGLYSIEIEINGKVFRDQFIVE